MAALNVEQLTKDIAKISAFGIEIRNDITATIIVANVVTAAQFKNRGTKIREALHKIKAV